MNRRTMLFTIALTARATEAQALLRDARRVVEIALGIASFAYGPGGVPVR